MIKYDSEWPRFNLIDFVLKIYFSDGWNTFDFTIVVGSFIDIAFSDDSVRK